MVGSPCYIPHVASLVSPSSHRSRPRRRCAEDIRSLPSDMRCHRVPRSGSAQRAMSRTTTNMEVFLSRPLPACVQPPNQAVDDRFRCRSWCCPLVASLHIIHHPVSHPLRDESPTPSLLILFHITLCPALCFLARDEGRDALFRDPSLQRTTCVIPTWAHLMFNDSIGAL